jgi:hypothetical protein
VKKIYPCPGRRQEVRSREGDLKPRGQIVLPGKCRYYFAPSLGDLSAAVEFIVAASFRRTHGNEGGTGLLLGPRDFTRTTLAGLSRR